MSAKFQSRFMSVKADKDFPPKWLKTHDEYILTLKVNPVNENKTICFTGDFISFEGAKRSVSVCLCV